jgi:predicted membrane metal-binding protein
MCCLRSCCMYCSCIRIPQRRLHLSVQLRNSYCPILSWVLELLMLAWESSRAAVWRIYAMVNCLCLFKNNFILSLYFRNNRLFCTKIVLASPACSVNQYKNLRSKVLKCCANVYFSSWFQTSAMFLIMYGSFYVFRHYIAIFREHSQCPPRDAQLRSSWQNTGWAHCVQRCVVWWSQIATQHTYPQHSIDRPSTEHLSEGTRIVPWR